MLQQRFGDWRAAMVLLGAGQQIHTAAARYRAITVWNWTSHEGWLQGAPFG